ncbi:TRAP transporter large permease [Salipaludibacillus agaradhaerens]|uniref:TRAP transporter large permease n=1 Tax=Salipaludibacillus agaradhaerens TaxID=76935 RepID=A0A9Q4FYZ9_SALAG|nr:TRAP transporter large permease [Salipaludibacillus agaradhaerens]MCR6098235.1 TRAP transporter large permease [Salipaludibacillus agaradhaerens]MCR6116135.1 TRAP transporter large permease [Salipaludibacillus agaradhaerens]
MILLSIIAIFFVCLLLGVPVAFSIIIASSVPILLEPLVSLTQVSSIMIESFSSFTLLAIPLFIFAGALMNLTKVTDDLIYISKALVGKFKGSLAHMNIITSIFFGAISGSSVADVASLGRILIPAMIKAGYSREFAATVTAASSTIGSIIPPSILLIVYGALAQTSVAALFIAGIVPGILIGITQMIYAYLYAAKNDVGAIDNKEIGLAEDEKLSKIVALKKGIFPLSLFLIVIVGIMSGVFTATEAASIAVIYVFIVAFFIRKQRNVREYMAVTRKAVIDSATIYILIAAAALLSWVLTYYQAMQPLIDFLLENNFSPLLFLLMLTMLYVFLGTFMEPNSAMLIFVPLLLPVMQGLQIDPVVAGIVTVMAIRLGTVTPPYGLSSLLAAKVAGTNVLKMMRHILIFVFIYLVAILLIIIFPGIVTFLPNLLIN